MWIRSQSKHALVECTQVEIKVHEGGYCIYNNGVELGMYLTYENALKVLEMIQLRLLRTYTPEPGKYNYRCFFQMPQDCEVHDDE